MVAMQISSSEYDDDTARLTIRMTDGAEYQIDNPAHAIALKDKISPGGILSGTQRAWLERYRVVIRHTNRERLRAKLREMREELREST